MGKCFQRMIIQFIKKYSKTKSKNIMSQKGLFTYAEIKAEILDLLMRQKFDRYKYESCEKTNDLRPLLCVFAHKVWGFGLKQNISAVQGLNEEQESLACEKSFLQALTWSPDRQQLQTVLSVKDKKIQQQTKQISQQNITIDSLEQQLQKQKQKIKQLCDAFIEIKQIHEQQIKTMKAQACKTTCHYSYVDQSEKDSEFSQIFYKLHLAEEYIANCELKFKQQNQLINQHIKKHKKLSYQNMCLQSEIQSLRGKNRVLQESLELKKYKIQELFNLIESNQKTKLGRKG